MRFDRTWSSGVGTRELRALAVDAAARRAALAGDGSARVTVVTEQHDRVAVVHVEREVPTGARGAAAAVVGRYLRLAQTERWDDPDHGGTVTAGLLVTFADRPIVVTGRIELTPTTTGCTQRVSGRVDARVPGIGGLLERRIVAQMFADLTRQFGAGHPEGVS